MRRGRAHRALGHIARIVERLSQTRMGFEPRSVRQIDDAGRDVIDGGIAVIAGNRPGPNAKRRGEAEQRPSAEAARLPLPLARRRSAAWRRGVGAADATDRRDGCAHPNSFSKMLRLSAGAAGRATATSGRERMALGRDRLAGRANSDGRGGGKGKLSVSPISGKSRPGGSGRLAAGGIAGAEGKRFEGRQRERRRSERSGFKARHLLRRRHGGGRLQLSEQIGVNGDVGEGSRDGRRRCGGRRPPGEDRVGSGGTEPVQSPDADSPSEGQGGPPGTILGRTR